MDQMSEELKKPLIGKGFENFVNQEILKTVNWTEPRKVEPFKKPSRNASVHVFFQDMNRRIEKKKIRSLQDVFTDTQF